VLIAARIVFQRRNPRPTPACRPPRYPWAAREGRAREGRDVAGGRTCHETRRKTWPSGARAARAIHATPRPHFSISTPRAPSTPPAEVGAQMGSSVAFGIWPFGSGSDGGQSLSGAPRKAPLCSFPSCGKAHLKRKLTGEAHKWRSVLCTWLACHV